MSFTKLLYVVIVQESIDKWLSNLPKKKQFVENWTQLAKKFKAKDVIKRFAMQQRKHNQFKISVQ